MTDSTRHADVIVVGAGPAGSSTAYWLAQAGLDVFLLEKATFPREKICGDGLTPRAVRALIGMGVDLNDPGWGRNRGLRIYGGGILSSIGETRYALSPQAERRRFNLMNALRTPYRIDIMQPVYYVIDDLRELYELTQSDLMSEIAEARGLGLFAPTFPQHSRAA